MDRLHAIHLINVRVHVCTRRNFEVSVKGRPKHVTHGSCALKTGDFSFGLDIVYLQMNMLIYWSGTLYVSGLCVTAGFKVACQYTNIFNHIPIMSRWAWWSALEVHSARFTHHWRRRGRTIWHNIPLNNMMTGLNHVYRRHIVYVCLWSLSISYTTGICVKFCVNGHDIHFNSNAPYFTINAARLNK